MATKSPDLRNRIPSVSELLEMPAVRAVSERWNRSVAASGVRAFLNELRSDLERRATEFELPSLRELAERAARHVARRQRPAVGPLINATGRLLDSTWIGQPLADEALQQLVALGSCYVAPMRDREPSGSMRGSSVATRLARLTNAEAALALQSYSGAIWLALNALAGGNEILVSRGDLGDVDAGCSLAALVGASTAKLREVGATNRTTASDFELAINDSTTVVVRHSSDYYRIVGDTASPEWEDLVSLCRDRELPLVHAAGSAPLVSDMPVIGAAIGSIAADVAAGVHLVIARGDGLVGGPSCGLLVGSRELIDRIEAHPLASVWQIDSLSAAALEATLNQHDDPQRLAQSLPLYQLLSASIENLRQRAERLAPQLTQAPDVAAAEAMATENSLGTARYDVTIGSCAIALSALDGDVDALDERLKSATVPIVGRIEGARLMLDLRTVLPRQDQQLVESIVDPSVNDAAATEASR
jgi:L-seryl-tRNA(Ser) seleniumtransferase